MSEPRLSAALEAAAILRKVSSEGDFGAILKRGDAERGSLLLIVQTRGEFFTCLQRTFDFASSTYAWSRVGPTRSASSADIAAFLGQQARFDPDLWQIELDIAQPERFIAETTRSG